MTKLTSLAILAVLMVTAAGCRKGAKTAGGADELFASAQQFQQQEKWNDAIKTYRKIATDYANTRQGANSQFMVGYIYANHIKDYEQAKTELQRFIDKFGASSDSGLVAGAKFEMQYMGKSIDEIPILSSIGGGTPDTTQPATPPAGK